MHCVERGVIVWEDWKRYRKQYRPLRRNVFVRFGLVSVPGSGELESV